MEYGTVEGVGKPISRLAQGTMMLKMDELEAGFALLDAVYALGCTTFDAAHIYGGGQCERCLGRWIEARGLRDKVVVLTKGAHHNADRRRVTPFDIASDLHDSLARLRTDSIDLYLLHRDDPSVPVGPIVEALNEQKAAGRIRAFGGSNWTAARIAEANEYARAHRLVPFSVSSPNFSLAEQVKEPWDECISISGPQNRPARAYYRRSQMPLFTWSSLAQGLFSGRVTQGNYRQLAEKGELPSSCVHAYCYRPNFRRLQRAAKLARTKGMTVPQIALAFVMNQPLNIFALVGCADGKEMRDNVAAMELQLTPAEMAWLNLETP